MKKLAFIVIFLVGTVGLFQWVSQGFSSSWEPRLRNYLEETAGRLTHTHIHIDSIAPAFFHRVRLVNVRVSETKNSPQPIFQASEIELTLSLIDMPRALLRRKAHEAIGLISVKNPWVRLSPDVLARHASRAKATGSLPPWFTLAWEGGTLQYLDPKAPRGAWTLYQAQGLFRIRGPQTNFAIRGSMNEAPLVRFQVSSLGKRWNSQLYIPEGDFQSVLAVVQKLTNRSLLPEGWVMRGTFDLEARAGGKVRPAWDHDPLSYLNQVILKCSAGPRAKMNGTPSVGISGTLTYQKQKITSSHLTFDSPPLEGSGRAEILLEGLKTRPQITIHAELPSGRLWGQPFQNAVMETVYVDNHWEFRQNTFRFLDGTVSAKGSVASTGSDMTITANNVSLAALGQEHGIKIPEGKLNLSCSLKGPFDDWSVAGAWWLTEVQWGQTPVGDARGDFEITAQGLRAQAKSDNSRFRVAMQGNQNEKTREIDRLEIYLPSGATFTGEGRENRLTRQIQGTFTASQIQFPSDLPFLAMDTNSLKGSLGVQGKLTGTLAQPVLLATLKSPDLTLGDKPVGATTATFHWEKSHWEIPAFHIEPGVDGQYADGKGTVKLENSTIGTWTLTQGTMQFIRMPDHLDITELAVQTKDLAVNWRGKIAWKKEPPMKTNLSIEGKGSLRSVRATDAWSVPFDMGGAFEKKETFWTGKLHFDAKALEGRLRGDYILAGAAVLTDGRFSAQWDNARWRAFEFTTTLEGSWGAEGLKPLLLNGRLKTGGNFQFSGLLSPEAKAQGTLKLNAFNIRPLGESLRFPKPMDGLMNATLTLHGPLASLKWNGHLEGGPLTYATTSPHPYKLEQFSMDMTLAPLPDNPSVARLTVIEGQAKTAEELIRFRSGSFVEFAGQNPSRFVMGTDIRNLHLGIFTLFGGLDLEGTWQIKPEGFAIEARSRTHSLFINDYELEEGLLLADYYNGVLKFSPPPLGSSLVRGVIDFHKAPQLKFTDFFISGKDREGLELSGDIGPSLWDFRMVGRGLDMAILGELAGFPYPLSGAADVQVRGTGDPEHPHVDGKVELDRGTVMGLSFRSGAAAFNWEGARITFTKLFLTDPGHYNLEGAGGFPLIPKKKMLNQDRSIDFSIRLKDSNLSLLQSMSHEVKQAKGPVEGLIQIKGTPEDPSLRGSLRVTNGEILGAHYFRRLQNGALWLEFSDDTITIRELRGKSGDGEFRGSGSITLSGFQPSKYDVKLEVVSSKGVDVQVPELAIPESPLAKRFKFLTTASRADVRGHVTLRGPAESPVFSGEGIISNGHFTFPPSRKRPPPVAVLAWFRRLHWDVNLKFLDGAWFENELVQAAVAGYLNLKGPSEKLRVDGGLDIAEGKISYLGLQFDIQQARYDIRSEIINDAVINTAYLRGLAESQTQAVDTVSGVAGASGGSRLNINDTITLTIDYAPIDQIKPRLTSAANPTLSQEKVLARVTQTDVENLTPTERNYLYQKQIVSLIDSSLTTPLAQNVLKKTGIADRVRVQHVFDLNTVTGQDLNTTASSQQQSSGANLFANTKYTVEKDLSDRLSLGYGVRFVPTTVVDPDLQQQQQKLDLVSDVQLSYRWFKNVYLKGDFELPSANPNILPERKVTIEPRWRFGWWGHTNKDKTKK